MLEMMMTLIPADADCQAVDMENMEGGNFADVS